jgi:hypothetical protein
MVISSGGTKKEKTDRLISMLLLTCYKRITDPQAALLIKMTEDDIDPMTDEYKELLQLELWSDLYENKDSRGLSKALNEISNTVKELKVYILSYINK